MNTTSKGENFLCCSYPFTVASWHRDSIYMLVAIPQDPKAPSGLHADSTREAWLLRGQGGAAGTLSVKEGRGYHN